MTDHPDVEFDLAGKPVALTDLMRAARWLAGHDVALRFIDAKTLQMIDLDDRHPLLRITNIGVGFDD